MSEEIARALFNSAERFWYQEGQMSRPLREYQSITEVEREYWLAQANALLSLYELRRK